MLPLPLKYSFLQLFHWAAFISPLTHITFTISALSLIFDAMNFNKIAQFFFKHGLWCLFKHNSTLYDHLVCYSFFPFVKASVKEAQKLLEASRSIANREVKITWKRSWSCDKKITNDPSDSNLSFGAGCSGISQRVSGCKKMRLAIKRSRREMDKYPVWIPKHGHGIWNPQMLHLSCHRLSPNVGMKSTNYVASRSSMTCGWDSHCTSYFEFQLMALFSHNAMIFTFCFPERRSSRSLTFFFGKPPSRMNCKQLDRISKKISS